MPIRRIDAETQQLAHQMDRNRMQSRADRCDRSRQRPSDQSPTLRRGEILDGSSFILEGDGRKSARNLGAGEAAKGLIDILHFPIRSYEQLETPK
jgi:hypothetical protein